MFRHIAAGTLAIGCLGISGPALAAELTIRIHDIPSGGGQIMIAVLGSEAAFDGKEPAIASLILPATASEITVSTSALPPGSYALRVMHDRNGDGEMNSNLLGMPTEPWGFSNDASGSFGPPGWQAARFDLTDQTSQNIRLNH
ncbi:MAG: DUF2141 domain-containing protein [Pseudomonadales bacterium]